VLQEKNLFFFSVILLAIAVHLGAPKLIRGLLLKMNNVDNIESILNIKFVAGSQVTGDGPFEEIPSLAQLIKQLSIDFDDLSYSITIGS
jgi:hypothetical protein